MIIAEQFSCLGPRNSNAGVDAVSCWSTGCSRNLVSVASNAALPSASARDACSKTRPYDAVRQAGNHVQVDPELMDMSLTAWSSSVTGFDRTAEPHQGHLFVRVLQCSSGSGGCARILMVINWLRNQGMFVVSGSAWPRYRGILKPLPTRVEAELSSQAGPGPRGFQLPLRHHLAGPPDGAFPAALGAARKRRRGSTVSVPNPFGPRPVAAAHACGLAPVPCPFTIFRYETK